MTPDPAFLIGGVLALAFVALVILRSIRPFARYCPKCGRPTQTIRRETGFDPQTGAPTGFSWSVECAKFDYWPEGDNGHYQRAGRP